MILIYISKLYSLSQSMTQIYTESTMFTKNPVASDTVGE